MRSAAASAAATIDATRSAAVADDACDADDADDAVTPATPALTRRVRSPPRPDGKARSPDSTQVRHRQRPCNRSANRPRDRDHRRELKRLPEVSSVIEMADRRYEPNEIEPKWQELWAREHTWEVANDVDAAEKSYVLEMLPYPSGEPHIGHLKNYALGDAIAHFRRRIGQQVLHPMGYDAFGLPAENHAINTGIHPRQSTDASIAAFQRAFRSWGISIDWSREFATLRAAVLPLDPVDLPQAARAGPRLPQGGRGQVVPPRPDRARQRAGHRRSLRALRARGRAAPARAVVLPDHRLRRPAARRP